MRINIRFILAMILLSMMLLPHSYAIAEISLDQAVQQAKQRTGGRVISAETRKQNGDRIHNIRILTNDGKVRRMQIRADKGRRNR
jgi:uncharacterized membrane protein YkoI